MRAVLDFTLALTNMVGIIFKAEELFHRGIHAHTPAGVHKRHWGADFPLHRAGGAGAAGELADHRSRREGAASQLSGAGGHNQSREAAVGGCPASSSGVLPPERCVE